MDWKEENNELVKAFTLENFSQIVMALPELGKITDELDHHPDFSCVGLQEH